MTTTSTTPTPPCIFCGAPAGLLLLREHPTRVAVALCRDHFLDVGNTGRRLEAMVGREIAAQWN